MNKKNYNTNTNPLSTLFWCLILSVSFLLPAKGQVIADGNGVAVQDFSVNTVIVPGFVVPDGNDRVLVVFVDWVASPGGASLVTGVEYDGQFFTHAVTGMETNGLGVNVYSSLWYLPLGTGCLNMPLGADIEITLNQMTDAIFASAASFQNVNQSTVIGDTDVSTAQGNASSTITLTTAVGDMTVDAIMALSSVTADINQTAILATSGTGGGASYESVGGVTNSMIWTITPSSPATAHVGATLNQCTSCTAFPGSPTVTVTASTITCVNTVSTLDGTGSTTGANISYEWTKISGTGNLIGSTTGLTATADGPGVFRLTVTDNTFGCENFTDVTVISNTEQVVSDNNGEFEFDFDENTSSTLNDFTIPEGCDRLLAVSVNWISVPTDGGSDAVTDVTYGGQSLTHIQTQSEPFFATVLYSSTWYLPMGSGCAISDPSGSSTDIIVSLNNSKTSLVYVGASTFQNVDQSAPIGNTDSNTGSSSVSNISIGGATGNMIWDAIMAGSTVTPNVTQTRIWEDPGAGASESYESGNGGTVSMDWTQMSSLPFVHLAAEIVNCSSCATFPVEPTATATPSLINCANANSTLDGTGSTTGGSIVYEWTKVSGTGNLVGATNMITATADGQGNFKLTVTDTDSNCSDDVTVTVSEDFTMPTATATASQITCASPTSTLDGTGSSTTNTTYAWTKVSGIGDLVGATNMITATADGPGVFKLTVMNTVSACTAETTVTVTEDASVPVATATSTVIGCMDPLSTLDGTGSTTGANITYSWTKISGSGNLVGSTSNITAMADGSGVFRLTVTNTILGCSGKTDVTVTTNTDIVTADNNGQFVFDSDEDISVTIPGFVAAEGCDRLLVVTVHWISIPTDNGADMVTGITYDGQNLIHAVTESEIFFATDLYSSIWYLPLGSGCEISGAVGAMNDIDITLNNTTTSIVYAAASTFQNVDQTSPIGNTATATGAGNPSLSLATVMNNMAVDAVMAGSTVTADASQTAIFTDPGAGASSSFESATGASVSMDWTQTSPVPFAQAAVELVNCSGCVTFPATPTVTATATDINCNSATATLDGTGSSTGANIVYEWTKVSGTGNLVGATNMITATTDGPGVFRLAVIDTDTDCKEETDVTVIEDLTPPTVNLSATVITCASPTSMLNGAGSSTGANFSYSWTKVSGIGEFVGATTNITATADGPGVFKLTITNTTSGCTNEGDVTVTEDASVPVATATSTVIGCMNPLSTLDGAGSSTGANITYSWTKISGTGNLVGATNGITASADGAGVFRLTVTNTTLGCFGKTDVTVTTNTGQVISDNNGVFVFDSDEDVTATLPNFNLPEGCDRLLVVTVNWVSIPTDNGADMVTGITYDGQNLIHAVTESEVFFATDFYASIWYLPMGSGCLLSDPSGTNADIVVSFNNLTTSIVYVGASSFQNVDQVNPIGNTATATGAGAASLNLTAAMNNMAVDAIMAGSTVTADASQTMIYSDPGSGSSSSYESVSGASVSMDWTQTSPVPFAQAAAELVNCAGCVPLPAAPTATATASTVTCANMVSNLDGTGSSTGANISYEWTKVSGTGNLTGATNMITATTDGPGVFKLTVTNTDTDCLADFDVTVPTDFATPTATATATTITCASPNSTLDGTGSTAVNATYAWTKVSGTGNLTGATNMITATADGSGVFKLTVTSTTNGCTADVDVTVMSDTSLPTVVVSSTTITCGTSTATVDGTGSSTGANFTYAWTKVSGAGNLVGATNMITATVDGTGVFKLTVTNTTTGCTNDADVTVMEDMTVPTATGTATDITCTASTANLDGTGSSFGANFTYAWTKVSGAGNLVGATNMITATVDGTGVFKLTVTNTTTGCTNDADITVNEDKVAPTVNTSATPITCTNGDSGLDGAGSSAGANFSYLWTKVSGLGNFIGGTNAIIATVDSTGVFKLTVTNNTNGCTAEMDVTVTEDKTAPTIATAASQITCSNPNSTLDGAGSSTGANFTYAWTKVSGAGNLAGATDAITAIADGTGVFNLVITNTDNGCTSTMDVTVTQDADVPTSTAAASVIDCNNATSTLDGAGSSTGANFTYSWTHVSGTGNLTGATDTIVTTVDGPGVFKLTVTNTMNGCTSDMDVTVNEDLTAPTIAISASEINCNNATSALGSVGSDTGTNFSFSWTKVSGAGNLTGSTTDTLATADGPGTFNLVITNTTNGCTSTMDIDVIEIIPPTVSIDSQVDVGCYGDSTGVATAITVDGKMPYTYAWQGGGAAATRSGLPAGTFDVTVTDADGCTSTTSVTINQPDSLDLSATSGFISTIGGMDGSATVNPTGGTAPFDYLWSNDSTTQTINGLGSGYYTVTVTDANLCQDTVGVLVYETLLVEIEADTVPFCEGENLPLTAITNRSVTYQWNNGSTIDVALANATGIYSVTVTDNFGNTAETNVYIETLPQPDITITPDGPNQFCQGGQVTLTASGGVSYVWDDINNTTGPDLTVSTTDGYTVVVTDTNGCTNTETFSVEVFDLPNVSITSATGFEFCEGFSVTLNAVADTIADFYWSTLDTNVMSITLTETTDVTLVAMDGNGCIDSTSVTVTEVDMPTAVIDPGTFLEFCKNTADSVDLTASGGVQFEWSNGATTQTIRVFDAAQYTVTVTDAFGCTDTETTEIVIHDIPTASITPIGPTVFCEGGSVELQADGGLTYEWSNGAMTQNITVTSGDFYMVTVTDANGCTDSESQLVQTNSFPVATLTPSDTSVCDGETAILTVMTHPANMLVWNTFETTPSIEVTNTGTYSVTITGVNDCTTELSTTFTVNPLPTVSVSPTDTLIQVGETVTLQASGGVQFEWSDGSSNGSLIAGLGGQYSVTVTDANGCTGVATANISVVNAPTVVIDVIGDDEFCEGESTTLTAIASGVPDLTYEWSTGEITPSIDVTMGGTYSVTVTDGNGFTVSDAQTITVFVMPAAPQITPSDNQKLCEGQSVTLTSNFPTTTIWQPGDIMAGSIDVNTSGTYSAYQIDANGCESELSDPVFIDVVPLPAPPVITASPDVVVCAPEEITLTSSYTFGNMWSNSSTGQTVTVSVGNPTFTVTHTDANGCTSSPSDPITVQVNLQPDGSITVVGDTIICQNEEVELIANGGVSYAWNVPGQNSASLVVSSPGNYMVTVTDANGCEDVVSQNVFVNQLPTPDIEFINDSLQTGNYVTYQWYFDGVPIPGATNQAHLPEETGTYTVEVTDANGCVGISLPLTDLIELANIGSVEVFPIPAQNRLFVNLTLEKQVRNIDVRLFNLVGQEVYFQAVEPRSSFINHEIDLENLPAGNYYLQIEADGQRAVQKVIKQ